MSFFVYVLACADKDGPRTYVGWTLDPDRRLAEHNGGSGARSTRGRVWAMIHVEKLASRSEAMSREWHLKRDRAFRRRLVEAWLRGGKKRA
ncbi:MAG TPA: GIY-YIG nuclease family protein [Bauldia sp.]